MIYLNKAIEVLCGKLARYILKALANELRATDLVDTLKLLEGLAAELHRVDDEETIEFLMEDYGIKINRGYTSEDAEFRRRSFGALQYIEDLADWFMNKKGLDADEAEIAAYATLSKHLREGYESKRSANGFGFIDFVTSDTKSMIDIMESGEVVDYAYYKELLTGNTNRAITITYG